MSGVRLSFRVFPFMNKPVLTVPEILYRELTPNSVKKIQVSNRLRAQSV